MASGFFALLDDIATLMDDVATMGKVAGKKTAGLLGDDLAVNAEKASGFLSDREIPVLWAITKGSFINKLIILPVAFLLSAYVPVVIKVILIIGGIYLSYEGAHKIYEWIVPHKKEEDVHDLQELTKEEMLEHEQEKIKSAIFVDFILSIEIIIIALSTVEQADLLNQILVVTLIAVVATIGVYGVVALIVRMDEFGVKLINLNERDNSFSDKTGRLLVNALPWVIKSLSVIGTIALILVSGGIFVHNIHFIHELVHSLPTILGELLVGIGAGAIILPVITLGKKLWKSISGKKV
ncbi:DUF808 domain-containing protein [Christiangramia sp. SM2212]|uniref:DUF808 domain-containing protein n=1 Tax=Christiangramia sediminicola TaxID=3073267 RepID=A0ABU1ERK1_9FLAO|nr:DUF808 domain-containing protein [Christiangramia sp. SM2212]MDR5591014.1 DUF808 domain-containing protein [Christiangramia sp. SM2212]